MTAADVASINLHSDVYQVLQLMAPQDTAATGELEVSANSSMDVEHYCYAPHVESDMN